MNKLFFTLSIFLISEILLAQQQEEHVVLNPGHTVHFKKDVSISASPGLLFNTPNGDLFAGGLKIRAFVGNRFSFDSDIMFGRDFMQLCPGIIGIPAILLGYQLGFGFEEGDFAEFLIMGALMLMSAEHFAYHIPVRGKTDISPYVSLLRFRQFTNIPDSEIPDDINGGLCFATGLEVNKYFGNFILSPYADYSIGYAGTFRGFTCGLNLGYYIPNKSQ
jgi:hypothetical protein